MLALTGTRDADSSPRSTHQLLDLEGAFGPIAKGSLEVTADNAEWTIGAAIQHATAPRPGPVHLAISSDAVRAPIAADAGGTPPAPSEPEPAWAAEPTAPPGDDTVARARELLAGSRRPAVLVGRGVLDPSRAPKALELVHAIGGPVAAAPKAKGVVPEDDPLYCGNLEGAGDELVVEFLRAADLVVCLGVDSVEFAKPWRLDVPIVHVDDVASDGYYETAVELTGDVGAAIDALGDGMGSRREPDWRPDGIAQVRQAVMDFLAGTSGGLRPLDVASAVREALPRDAITTIDVGAHKLLLCQAWPAYAPRTFFVANGLSPMGYAVPVAAASRLVSPETPVVAFVGDGGLAMYLGELETVVRFGLDLLIVVFADESLELIRVAQAKAGLPEVGTSFRNPDWSALGRAFGIEVHEVDTLDRLGATVDRAVKATGVRLLVAHIDRGAYRL
jgi:acetolactate synthase-1/2/3 large subunit